MQERDLFQKYYRTATLHSKYLLHNLNKDPVLAFYLITLMLNKAHKMSFCITSKFAGFLLPTWSIKNKIAENTPQNPLTCLLFPDILPSPVQYLMRKRICIRKAFCNPHIWKQSTKSRQPSFPLEHTRVWITEGMQQAWWRMPAATLKFEILLSQK